MAFISNPYGKFMETQIATTPPEKLVLMCYDGIIRFCNRAIECIHHRDIQGAHDNIIRAQAIVDELRASLSMGAGEIARNLDRLYDFAAAHLLEANIRKDAGKLREVIEIVSPLREAWAEACVRAAQPQPLRAV